jgi:hypothetical protein
MRPLFLLMASVVAWTGAGIADAADSWHATQVAGEVRVEIGSGPAVPLTVAMSIEREALIETAASGSATLVRGEEHVIIAPNSRLRLPVDDGSGLTRVIEEFGQLFFQVGKKTTPHFRVETPMLAATVKGTTFTVAVYEKGTNVSVSDGLVLVHNTASSDETYVAAGRTASVAAAEPMTLYLDHSVVPPAALRLGEARPAGFANTASAAAPELQPAREPSQHAPRPDAPVPQIALITGPRDAHRSPQSMVIDSTLFGIGVGILAAALAIVFIGTNRRPPGMVGLKAKRAANNGANTVA